MIFRIQTCFLFLAIFVLFTSWSYTQYVIDIISDVAIGGESRGEVDAQALNIATLTTHPESATSFPVPSISVNTQEDSIRTPKSLFDCGPDVQNPTCVYFDPSVYFHPATSPLPPARLDYVKHYWSNKFNTSNSTENAQDQFWFSIQQDVGVYNLLEWSGDGDPFNSSSTSPPSGWPRTMMGLHIHKCGGSSVGRTFLKVSRGGSSDVTKGYNLTLFYRNNLRAKFENDHVASRSIEMHLRLLQHIYENQKESSLSSTIADHVAFAFVREPVGRFLSSVREFLVSRNKRRRICLEAPTSKELLKCLLSKLKQENGLQLDQHFAPATVSLYMFSLLEPRANISILPLSTDTMTDFQTAFLGPQPKTIQLKSSKPRKFNIVMDELDAGMIRDICHLYYMDVILMRHVGIPVPYCEGVE
jgi:Sulfotransferase family